MKRTYKFRGQSLKEYDPLSRTKKGTWLDGDLHTQDEYAAIDNGKFTLEVDPDTVGQYIGITDTSTPPKEIYDGDIIEGKSGMRHLVKYEEDLAAFVAYFLPYDEDLAPCHITKKWVEEFEKKVIGNVFDNGNLLKK